MNKARLKVCCISSREEMEMAVKYGASAIGLVGDMPTGPGIISLELARDIACVTPSGIDTFLLTSATRADVIIDEVRYTGVSVVQLVDAVEWDVYPLLRQAVPNVRIVQVIHVLSEEDGALAAALAPQVDCILLDSGNPALAKKELGGTGRVHNWQISRRIVEQVNKPVFLAGGISPANVVEAIAMVRPYGIDLCSGVRSGGKLDTVKLAALTAAMGIGVPG